MTGRSFALSIATTIGVLAVAAYCSMGPKPKPLSEGEVKARIEYRVQIVVDSARVKQLEAENLRLARVAASQVGRAKKSDSLATEFREAADSVSTAAYRAFKDQEKAQLWQEAAHTYRLAADAATMASKTKDSTLAVRDSQIMRKDEVISTEQARSARAEQRVAYLEPLAAKADDCKIARFINCPTRRQSFLAGGAVAGTLVAVVLVRR